MATRSNANKIQIAAALEYQNKKPGPMTILQEPAESPEKVHKSSKKIKKKNKRKDKKSKKKHKKRHRRSSDNEHSAGERSPKTTGNTGDEEDVVVDAKTTTIGPEGDEREP